MSVLWRVGLIATTTIAVARVSSAGDAPAGGANGGSGGGTSIKYSSPACGTADVPPRLRVESGSGSSEQVDWCELAAKRVGGGPDGPVVVCINADDGCLYDVRGALSGLDKELLPANRSIVVIARASTPADVAMDLSGSLGITQLATDTGGIKIAIAPEVSGYYFYRTRFAPRTPGPVKLSVSVTPTKANAGGAGASGVTEAKAGDSCGSAGSDAGSAATTAVKACEASEAAAAHAERLVAEASVAGMHCMLAACTIVSAPDPNAAKPAAKETEKPATTNYPYEFLIPDVYGGALRLGFGAICVPALAHSYGARKAAGGDFSTVVDNGADPVAVELVVGYAPFLFAKHSRAGGRTYTPGENEWTRFAPFFGVGVISSTVTTAKVDYLRSFYFGFEYELTAGSSIAIAGVVRRTDQLAHGLEVGAPVDPGTTVTRVAFDFGLGVVVNITPKFFQFASAALPKL